MPEQDTPTAAQTATVPAALELNNLNLIGLMAGQNGAAALLRASNGKIARVSAGDVAFGVTVTAIGEDMILMTDRWGRTRSLALPTG